LLILIIYYYGLSAWEGAMRDDNSSGSTLRDPVCGKEVNPGSPFRAIYEGRDFFFCSRHCLAEFQENPKKYLTPPLLMDPVCGMSGHELQLRVRGD
jgi:YHS domain-containing protein